jgi:chromosome segregation ATPase
MVLLNIFQNSDGTFAWENIVILVFAFVLGYLLHRFSGKQKEHRVFSNTMHEWENKYKKLENEYKVYKTNIVNSEKHGEKSLTELGHRVKSLEGDIRALSDEKNKYHHQLASKAEELKSYSKQVADLDDELKAVKEANSRSEYEWNSKYTALNEALTRASAWEGRVRAAEEEALKARAALNLAERRKLESELRLKSTTEYAGKVVPLENDLANAKERLSSTERELNALKKEAQQKDELLDAMRRNTVAEEALSSKLKSLEAQMELQKENNSILQKEFELKHSVNLSLKAEIENLRQALTIKSASEPNLVLAQAEKNLSATSPSAED